MQLRLNDPALIPDLRQHFERSGFVTNRVDDATIEVWRSSGGGGEQLERDAVETHLAIWRAVHENVDVRVID
jgi:hypothetical protein